VSREVAANGGRLRYRAAVAHVASRHRARRPKPAKLTMNPRLRAVVEAKLSEWWSPSQISSWLVDAYPGDEEMRVSHETIYQSLFVQGRGALRKELWRCLRTGRAVRRPQGRSASTKGQIRDMVMISQRPAEVEDRAVPGHWEGDLLMGKGNTAIGTLVERWSRYVMLFGVPDGNTTDAVRVALEATVQRLPTHLWESLTRDQGKEMVNQSGFSGGSGVPWVWWRRLTGFMPLLSLVVELRTRRVSSCRVLSVGVVDCARSRGTRKSRWRVRPGSCTDACRATRPACGSRTTR
jgi:IS30 family transposase